jgi:Ras-related protein Rab-22
MSIRKTTREVKVVLLGDQGVGKSSLVLRFVTQHFREISDATIGASFMSKMLMIPDEETGEMKPINFKIWDTAGQEKYHSLAPMYYRGAAAAIVVYDITKKRSFKTLQNWVNELITLGPENIVICIAGNKADLNNEREIDFEMALNYAKEVGDDTVCLETSAKEDTNVNMLFKQIAKRLDVGGSDSNNDGQDSNGGKIDLRRKRTSQKNNNCGAC